MTKKSKDQINVLYKRDFMYHKNENIMYVSSTKMKNVFHKDPKLCAYSLLVSNSFSNSYNEESFDRFKKLITKAFKWMEKRSDTSYYFNDALIRIIQFDFNTASIFNNSIDIRPVDKLIEAYIAIDSKMSIDALNDLNKRVFELEENYGVINRQIYQLMNGESLL